MRVEPRQLVQYYWLALNQTDPRFQDVRVRQAFDYAIDRQAIITAVEKGYGKPANSAIVPALQGVLRPVARDASTPFNPDKAKQLLAEAGWTARARTASCRRTASRSSSPWTSASAACSSRPTS